MPEGPECRIIVEGLHKLLVKKRILTATFISGRYTKNECHGFNEFVKSLPLTVIDVKVKGKFIYVMFHDGSFLWNTLGMSGRWTIREETHNRLVFELDDGSRIWFNDQRNFGTLKFGALEVDTNKKLASLGLDLLNEDHDFITFRKRLKRKKNLKKTLAEVMMDQSNLAGVGNYIKAEALYRARLSPHRNCESLTNDDLQKLQIAVQDVIQGSYAARGATSQNYRDIDGNIGKFEKVVYKKSVCPLGHPVITDVTKDKRVTHWVPKVQI